VSRYDPRLLMPPEEEELYPYRRVWRSLSVEVLILLITALVLYVLVNFVSFEIPAVLHRVINVILACFPLGLWLVFSRLQEQFAPEPRVRLVSVVVLSALVANAVGLPLINDFLQVDRWLPPANALTRILGYTFTVGVIQEILKYLVIRYTVWPDCFRTRLDGVAYGLASAVGYATVLNLHYVFTNSAAPNTAMLRIFDATALQYAGSILVGYGLAETGFGRPTPLLLTLTLAAGATLAGVAIPVRAGLVNASLGLDISTGNPLQGLVFSLVLVIAASLFVAFVTENTERQEREAAAGKDV
jgi:RsiW-degrading membrane proteinase PrsW (M82 family)